MTGQASPPVDGNDRIERVVESTAARLWVRWGTPILLMILGGFIMRTTDRIEATQAKQGEDISSIKSDVRDVNTRLDAQVIRQVNTNTKSIENLETRMQTVERATKIP